MKGLDLDFDGPGLISDDGNPFDDLDPYNSEYEAYTGNAGPTLEQWYHTCVCVIWPASQAVAIACGAGFAGAVQLAARRVAHKTDDAARTLTEVTDFARRNLGNKREVP